MADRGRPNVLFLIFDTLRADVAYAAETVTPTLDRIAERGTRFEQAYSVNPGTPVSHAAMFSGQYPSETGVVGQTDVPEDIPLLAETLRDAGYDTVGIPGPSRMGSAWGYDRGFEEYVETYAGDRPSYESLAFPKRVLTDATSRGPLVRDFLRMLRRGPDSQTAYKFDYLAETIDRDLEAPFFGMLNTTIAHSSYNPPRPYKESATPALDRPRWHLLEHLLGAEETLDRDDVRAERIYEAQTTEGIARFLTDPDYLTEAELDVLRAWYRASVEYLDRQLDRFLSRLERLGELENTILVLTADHGEYFGEHGLFAHSHFLYEEALHVPLIVDGPGVPNDHRTDLVSLVDLFDTICDLASVPRPEETSGVPLFGPETRDAVFSEYGVRHRRREGHRKYMDDDQLEAFGVGRKCVRTEEYTYEYTSAGEEALYWRPEEAAPVDDPDPDLLEQLRDRLDATLGLEFQSVTDDRDLDDDVEANLRELGYIE